MYIYISMYIMSYYIYVILKKKNIRIYMNKDINTLKYTYIYIYIFVHMNI